MSQDGEINLGGLKATYSLPDVHLVDYREIRMANEFRFTGEISLSIGLTLLGSSVSGSDWRLWIICIAFLIFGIINFIRFSRRNTDINVSVSSDVK